MRMVFEKIKIKSVDLIIILKYNINENHYQL